VRRGEPVMRSIRFRPLGCYPLTGAVLSEAATLTDIIRETALTTTPAQGRAIAQWTSRRMEKRRRRGYFSAGRYRAPPLRPRHRRYLPSISHKSCALITGGSVETVKSTLIGPAAVRQLRSFRGPARYPRGCDKPADRHPGQNIRLRLLVVAWPREREQGITIDVAYRYFERRKENSSLPDTQGPSRTQRNMSPGASTDELAVS